MLIFYKILTIIIYSSDDSHEFTQLTLIQLIDACLLSLIHGSNKISSLQIVCLHIFSKEKKKKLNSYIPSSPLYFFIFLCLQRTIKDFEKVVLTISECFVFLFWSVFYPLELLFLFFIIKSKKCQNIRN